MPKDCTCSVWQPKADRISFTLLAKIGLRSVCHKPSKVEFLQRFLEFAALDSLVPAALDWIWFELWPTYQHNEMSIEPLDRVEPFVSGKVFVKKERYQMFSLKDRLTYLAAYSMQNRTCQSDQSCRWLASIPWVVRQPVEKIANLLNMSHSSSQPVLDMHQSMVPSPEARKTWSEGISTVPCRRLEVTPDAKHEISFEPCVLLKTQPKIYSPGSYHMYVYIQIRWYQRKFQCEVVSLRLRLCRPGPSFPPALVQRCGTVQHSLCRQASGFVFGPLYTSHKINVSQLCLRIAVHRGEERSLKWGHINLPAKKHLCTWYGKNSRFFIYVMSLATACSNPVLQRPWVITQQERSLQGQDERGRKSCGAATQRQNVG